MTHCGNAMLDRRRALDQPRVDLARSPRLRRPRRIPRATAYQLLSLDRRHIAADDQLLVERLAQRCEIALAAHFAGKAAAGLQRAEDRARRLLLLQHPVQRRVGESRVELGEERACPRRRISSASTPFARAAAIISGELSMPEHGRAALDDLAASASPRRSRRRGSARPAADRAGRAPPRRARRRTRRPGHSPRHPTCWSRRRLWLKASSPTRGRRLRPSARRARPDCRA